MKNSCFYCGYLRKEETSNGVIRYYCNDRDCFVDPYEPECNYE